MKVSIITVCFNSEKTIKDTIDSVMSQNYDNIEHIIVDGLSMDSTIKILSEYEGNITKLISEPDMGIYDAMNKGIELATGSIVGILNSDDFFESPTVISDVVNKFKSNTELSLVFGDVIIVKPSDINKVIRLYTSNNFQAWKLRFGWMPPHPASFFKKTAYELIGKYSLEYKIAADYELYIRMLVINKLKYAHLDKVLVRMRTGGVSTKGIKSSILLNYEIVKACKHNGIYTNLFFVLIKTPFKLLELLKKPKGIT